MEFFLIIVGIAVLSIVWAYFSLKQEMKKPGEEKKVKEDLAKGRVIFYSSSESEESTS